VIRETLGRFYSFPRQPLATHPGKDPAQDHYPQTHHVAERMVNDAQGGMVAFPRPFLDDQRVASPGK